MPNFQTAYNRLMRTVNRPLSETDVLEGAKDAINDAISFLQRNHAYTYTEKLNKMTYSAGSLLIDLGKICGGTLRDMRSIQQTSGTGVYQGKPLKVMSYDQVQAQRSHYERTHTVNTGLDESRVITAWTIEDSYRCDVVAFLIGQSVGIYPTPNQDLYLVMNNHIWLPTLVNTTDTNFFLTYAMDVVIAIALKSMHLYMKADSRFAVTEQQITDMLAGLVAWDSSLLENSNTSIR